MTCSSVITEVLVAPLKIWHTAVEHIWLGTLLVEDHGASQL